MRAVRYGDGPHAGVTREVEVVRGVAYHKRFPGSHAGALHQRQKHLRMRLWKSLIGAARCDEMVADAVLGEGARQAGAAFTGCHAEQEAAPIELIEHVTDPLEQRNVRIANEVMRAIALGKACDIRCRQRRCYEGDRVAVAEPDHVPRTAIIRRGESQVAAGLLYRPRNERCRIRQRPIPVEYQQAIANGRLRHRRNRQVAAAR